MDRRSFLATGATAALLPLAEVPALAVVTAKAGNGDAKLNAAFDQILQERVQNSPTLASSLGLDKGPNAALKAKFDTDPAPVARAKNLQRNHRAIARLRAISPAMLSDAAKLNRDVVLYSLETNTVAPSRWNIDSAQRPYPITQQGGAYFSTPDFLNTTHTIENVRLPEPDLMKMYVGAPGSRLRNLMDPQVPLMSGVVQNQDSYMKGKIAQRKYYDKVLPALFRNRPAIRIGCCRRPSC